MWLFALNEPNQSRMFRDSELWYHEKGSKILLLIVVANDVW